MIPPANTPATLAFSETSSKGWRLSKYSLLAHIYFFFNSTLLPKGLLYTNVLSPVFFYNLLKNRQKTYWLPFAIFLLIYDSVHLAMGVDLKSFFVSNALFVSTYFFAISFYHFVNNYSGLGRIFRQLLLFNGVMVLIAIPFFFAPRHYKEWFWYFNPFTSGVSDFPRLALLTYEASYYSLLLAPLVIYYLLKIVTKTLHNNAIFTLVLTLLPLLLSFSLGVMGAMLVTALIMCFVFRNRVFKYKRSFNIFSLLLFAIVTTVTLLFIYFPDNFFVIRMQNIMAGRDTSTNGRIVESYTLGWRLADLKNIYTGVGLGQIKIMNKELVHRYYNYWGDFKRYDIPNAMGETLAIFGLVGVAFRILLAGWLFFKTRVYANYYRLALFIFIFIYQFTGSFITNSVEYVIWGLAFSGAFRQFDVQPKRTVESVT